MVFDFTFANGLPDFAVSYGDLRDESGRLVPIESNQVLVVRFAHVEPAAGSVDRDQQPELVAVREVKYLGEFEGIANAGIGVATAHGTAPKTGFRAFTTGNSVVVDVAHYGDFVNAQ